LSPDKLVMITRTYAWWTKNQGFRGDNLCHLIRPQTGLRRVCRLDKLGTAPAIRVCTMTNLPTLSPANLSSYRSAYASMLRASGMTPAAFKSAVAGYAREYADGEDMHPLHWVQGAREYMSIGGFDYPLTGGPVRLPLRAPRKGGPWPRSGAPPVTTTGRMFRWDTHQWANPPVG